MMVNNVMSENCFMQISEQLHVCQEFCRGILISHREPCKMS